MSEERGDTLKEMQERISGYHVYDRHYERVGKVDDLFVGADDELEYIGLKLGGMFGSKTALVPMDLVRINDRRDLIEIEADKEQVEAAPTFGKDEEITPDYEDKVHRHFGLQTPGFSGERGPRNNDAGEDRFEERDADVDTEYGERAGARDGDPGETPAEDTQGADRSGSSRPGRSVPEYRRPDGTEEYGEQETPAASGGPRVRKLQRVRVRQEEGRENADMPGGAAGPGEDAGRFR